MSDRISIDHINNNITIHVSSLSLADMSAEEVVAWVGEFILNLQQASLSPQEIGEIKEIKKERN